MVRGVSQKKPFYIVIEMFLGGIRFSSGASAVETKYLGDWTDFEQKICHRKDHWDLKIKKESQAEIK